MNFHPDINFDSFIKIHDNALTPDFCKHVCERIESDTRTHSLWVDANENGYPDSGLNADYNKYSQTFNNQNPEIPDQNNYDDLWPLVNRIWDEGEIIYNDVNNDGVYNENTDIILENVQIKLFEFVLQQ